MSSRSALARLRDLRAGHQLTLARSEARNLVEADRMIVLRPDADGTPLDYALDEHQPAAARPMFRTCEIILLASLAGLGLIFLWIGFGG
ncbi:MAG: hypothetical protein LCH86_20990 [Proteobacteria bacterium]|nr:hypothetical protein [Pseudomonadota bacterium]